MAFVAIAALNLGVIRALFKLISPDNLIVLWAFGALLMVNLLAIGVLIGYRNRGSRNFVWGFELFGATALAIYIAGAILYPEELVIPCTQVVLGPLVASTVTVSLTPDGALLEFSTSGTLLVCSAAIVIPVLPLLAIALLGGLITRTFLNAERPSG